MRVLASLMTCVVCLCMGNAFAEDSPARASWHGDASAGWTSTAEHRDRRHGHDHVYPDRGAVVRDVPRGATVVNYAGVSYRFADGVWFEPRGPVYIVVAPPIGLLVPEVPTFATPIESGADTYLYANDTYYRSRPGLPGYEVVNAPPDVGAPDSVEEPTLRPLAPDTPDPLTAAPAAQPIATAAAELPSRMPGTARYIYPRNGQSTERQARDRGECYRFALGQTGYDPLRPIGTLPAQRVDRRSNFSRAEEACFDALGYTVR
jgi:hypothetical protein